MTREIRSLATLKRWLRPLKLWLKSLVEVKSSILLSRDVAWSVSSNSRVLEPAPEIVKVNGRRSELPVSPAELQRRTCQGNDLYGVVVGRRLVSWGWVAGSGTRVSVVHNLYLRVPKGAFYIWDCATEPAFRGQGYFQALLDGILRAHRDTATEALVTVDTGNRASRKALVKAGFKHRFNYISVRVMGSVLFSIAFKGRQVTRAQPQFDGLNLQTPNN